MRLPLEREFNAHRPIVVVQLDSVPRTLRCSRIQGLLTSILLSHQPKHIPGSTSLINPNSSRFTASIPLVLSEPEFEGRRNTLNYNQQISTCLQGWNPNNSQQSIYCHTYNTDYPTCLSNFCLQSENKNKNDTAKIPK